MDSGLAALRQSGMTSSLAEHPLALQIHDLPPLVERERYRVVVGRIGIGADEAMLFAHAADVAFDRAHRLIAAASILVRRRADDEAFVFHRLCCLCGPGRLAPAEQRAPERHSGLLSCAPAKR